MLICKQIVTYNMCKPYNIFSCTDEKMCLSTCNLLTHNPITVLLVQKAHKTQLPYT